MLNMKLIFKLSLTLLLILQGKNYQQFTIASSKPKPIFVP